jgi:hypothetical protein
MSTQERNGNGESQGSPDGIDDMALDALLLRFGGDYNRPPDFVPREEMWHAIKQHRERRRLVHQHPVWNIVAAAVLLLGVGIGVGVEAGSRIVARTSSAPPARAIATATATPDAHALSPVPAARVDPADGGSATDVARRRLARNAPQPDAVPVPDAYDDGAASGINDAARSTAYTLATARHFTAVEALLTSFQTSPRDARADAQMASWARALLSQTRLLLDSPAATDPVRRKLLQDLELVLVQMTQLSADVTPIDREMIDGSVRRTDVITRLRTAVPAGGSTHL